MIPYFEVRSIALGPFQVTGFGLCLVAALLWARWVILRRAAKQGIDPTELWKMCFWMGVSGFLGAHLVKTILPDIPRFLADPWLVFRFSRGIASFGGLGGGLLGGLVYCMLRRTSAWEVFRRLDVIAYALPSAWMFGRFGCFLVHDHQGLPTTSWIGVAFPEGPRYDLGLIECLFLIALALAFRLLDRVPRPAGFFFALYGVSYGLFRIWLDTLHIQPMRFRGGATVAAVGLAGWAIMAWSARRRSQFAGP